METYRGGCHCGAVRFCVRAAVPFAVVCNCSICTKKGFLHLIVERSQFDLIAGAGELTSYRFGTGVAEHLFCKRCGIHSFYTPRSDPEKVDINVRCLDGVDLSAIDLRPFDGAHWEAAIGSAPWRHGRP